MSRRPRSRRRRIFWFCFRWLLMAGLLLAVLLAGFSYFLNQLGLPEFVKRRVVAQIRSLGWEVQFSRLRLRWYSGVIIDHLQLQRTNPAAGPFIFVEEARVPLDRTALRNFGLHPTSVRVRGGRLIWPLTESAGRRHLFAIDQVDGLLGFRPDDLWLLRALRARFRGIHFVLNGNLTNASALARWKPSPDSRQTPVNLDQLIRNLEKARKQIRLRDTPILTADFQGDARDPASFNAQVRLEAAGVESPWGAGDDLLLTADLNLTRQSNAIAEVRAVLTASGVDSRWGSARDVQANLSLDHCWKHPVPTNASLDLTAGSADTPWGKAVQLSASARTTLNSTNHLLRQSVLTLNARDLATRVGHAADAQVSVTAGSPLTNWLPASALFRVSLEQSDTPWGGCEKADLRLQATCPETHLLLLTNLPWTDRLAGIPVDAQAVLTRLRLRQFETRLACVDLRGSSPDWHLDLSTDVADGQLRALLDLNAATRHLAFAATNSLPIQSIAALLGTNAQTHLAAASWSAPPHLAVQGHLRLPSWTNRAPDWRRDLLPSLDLAAQIEAGHFGYRGAELHGFQASLSLTNSSLRLAGFTARRPEGNLEADLDLDLYSLDFQGRFQSSLHPGFVESLFTRPKHRRVFEVVRFSTPPRLAGEVRGRWGDWSQLAAAGRIGVTNFTVNGQSATDCAAALAYTNQFLAILAPQLGRGAERAVADGIGIDLRKQHLFLTNAQGNINPYLLLRAINTNTARALENYRFAAPPSVRISGRVGLIGRENAEDLRLRVDGGAFQWKMFKLPVLGGDVHVLGETARLTNVTGGFYGGSITGDAWFDWSGSNGTDFRFTANITDTDLRLLVAGISAKTNKVEGTLGGRLVITSANSELPLSWQGFGRAELRNGLLWNFPFFGIFSAALNSLIPGLGNSRAKEGVADFAITNSVIYTGDLDIRATAMRMHYSGKVGFDETVAGRMEAELLRDMPAIGIFMSKVFWPFTKLFEYEVTGTLDDPQARPLYLLPKVLLLPLNPVRSFKDLFAPPETKPAPPSPPP